MSTTHDTGGINTHHQPTEQQEALLDVMRDRYVTNPTYLMDELGLRKQRIQQLLDPLMSAGWVTRISRGVYRLDYDGHGLVTHTIHYRHEDIGVKTLSERDTLTDGETDTKSDEEMEADIIAELEEDLEAEDEADEDEDEDDEEDEDDGVDEDVKSELDRLIREAGIGESEG